MTFISTTGLKVSLMTALWSQLQAAGFATNLVKAPFTPQLGTTLADITYADFVGYVAMISDPNPFVLWNDVLNSLFQLTPNQAPAARHVAVAGAIVAPQLMYGFCLQDGITTDLLCTKIFDAPIQVNATGDGCVIPLEFLSFHQDFLA